MAKRAKNYQMAGYVDPDSKTPEIIEQSIKRLSHCQVLSNEWYNVAAEIQKITNISSIEISKNLEAETKMNVMGTSGAGTLWDTDESLDTLRILVDNYKLNVLLHLVKDIKELMRSSNYFEQINLQAHRLEKPPQEISNRIDHLEFDIGLVLKRLFEHVEAIQTCDLGILMEHISATLRAIIESRFNPDNIELRQESLVFNYIYGLFHFIEQLNEAQIIQWAKQYQLPNLLIEIFVEKSILFTPGCKQKMLEALGALADCVRYIQENLSDIEFTNDPEHKSKLVQLRKELIRDLIVDFPDRRPAIRPFLDIIDKYEREIKFPKKK